MTDTPVIPELDVLAAQLRRWREDPVLMVRELFDVEPDAWQTVVLRAFVTNQRLAMKAAKGCGKSTALAWMCWNFLLTRPHPKVVATSITGDNLKDGLWSEMSKWQQRSALLKSQFTWSAERIVHNDHPETWWMSARQWSKTADASQQANTLAGIHADYVLIVADEAGGIPDAVVAAAEGGLSTGIECKLVIAGNPTHLSGPLYRACTRERALWFLIEITGDPDDPKRSPRISQKWAREQIQKYGRANPWVLVNVFGQFPPGQSNALISLADVIEATRRTAKMRGDKRLGVDVARFGDDRSVLCKRQGDVAEFDPELVFRNLDTMELADEVVEVIRAWHPRVVSVDVTGIGAGVVDRLQQLEHEVNAVEFGGAPVSVPPEDRDEGDEPDDLEGPRFLNRRTEIWWLMAQWIRTTGCIPDDAELISELAGPTYKFTADGKLQLESKADMKKRGLASPDKADALALTFAEASNDDVEEDPGPPQRMGLGAQRL